MRALGGGLARGGGLDELERLRRHDGDLRHGARLMAAASGALQQARDALRAADLQHLVDGRVVDAEVEARRADDGAQPRCAAGRPRPSRALRARASRDGARSGRPSPAAPRGSPGTRSRSAERTLVKTSVERALSIARTTCGSSLRPMWPPQGKRSIVGGRAVSIAIVLAASPSHDATAACPGPTQARERLVEIGERRRQAPDAKPRRAGRAAARARARPARRASTTSARAIRRRRRRRGARSARASRRATAAASGSRAW